MLQDSLIFYILAHLLTLDIFSQMMDFTESSSFPHFLIPEVAKLGLVGADFPREIGGKGLSCPEVGSMFYELAKKDGSLATFPLLHHSLG